MNESGRAPILLIVISAALGIGLGASLFFNFSMIQKADQDKDLLNGEITDLRYQLKQGSASPTPTPAPVASVAASPSPSPTPVLGTQTVNLEQLGVHLAASDPISDLTYEYKEVSGLATANFTTAALLAKYPACKPGVLGMLVRRPKASKPSSASKLVKAIGDYNYYYVASAVACAPDASGKAAVAAARSALQATVLPTISN